MCLFADDIILIALMGYLRAEHPSTHPTPFHIPVTADLERSNAVFRPNSARIFLCTWRTNAWLGLPCWTCRKTIELNSNICLEPLTVFPNARQRLRAEQGQMGTTKKKHFCTILLGLSFSGPCFPLPAINSNCQGLPAAPGQKRTTRKTISWEQSFLELIFSLSKKNHASDSPIFSPASDYQSLTRTASGARPGGYHQKKI